MSSTRSNAPESNPARIIKLFAVAALGLSAALQPLTTSDARAAVLQASHLSVEGARTLGTVSKPAVVDLRDVDAAARLHLAATRPAVQANKYLRWFQDSVRDKAPKRMTKNWSLYVKYAKQAGLKTYSKSYVTVQAKKGKSVQAGTSGSTVKKALNSSSGSNAKAASLANKYLRWFQYSVRDKAPRRMTQNWGLYVKYANQAGLDAYSRSYVEAQARKGAYLKALGGGSTAPKALNSNAGSNAKAAALANRYLCWFWGSVRDKAPYRIKKNWNLYTSYASKAGFKTFSKSYVEGRARKSPKCGLSAAGAGSSSGGGNSTAQNDVASTGGKSVDGKAPSNWDNAYQGPSDLDGKASNGEASSYVKSLIGKMVADVVGSGGKAGQGYLAKNYKGYSIATSASGRSNVYIRHTGFDFPNAIGKPVRAVAPGQVVAIIGNVSDPNTPAVVVKENGANRWWIYGHIAQGVKRGQNVTKGSVVGKITNPKGQFKPHVHVTVFTTAYPLQNKSLKDKFGWGRTYTHSASEAVSLARAYTMHPLEAYARANGYLK